MALFRRKPRLPADQRPALERDERVVAWAPATPTAVPSDPPPSDPPPSASTAVVVTNRGLWPPGARRIDWHRIHKAVWSGRVLTITPAEVVREHPGYAVLADAPVQSYLLLEPGEVPHQVRLRVTGSVAYSEHHQVPGVGGLRVVARRVSGVDGLTWTVRFDPGSDTDSPAAHAAVDQLLTQARHTTAPPP